VWLFKVKTRYTVIYTAPYKHANGISQNDRESIMPKPRTQQVSVSDIRKGFQRGILFGFEDYLTLVDCTGRIAREDKRGTIEENMLPILKRLNLDPDRWCERATQFETTYNDYRCHRRRAA
jgi:hypothetical protein